MYDDFCLDETRGVAFVTAHGENRLDVLSLMSDGAAPEPLIGAPFDDRFIGSSSAA